MSDLYQAVTSKVSEAIQADEAGNAVRALQLMLQAQMAMAAIPDGKNEDSEATFDREAINAAVDRLQRKVNASRGVVTEAVRHARG
ncbi:MAG: hypothetical protein AAGD07_16090 [Planctomycetota bacterium]